MCGICGIISTKNGSSLRPESVMKMMGALSHRGPDSSGYYRDRNILLGHTRLAIIDLVTGAQPLSNEDESIWITFNGEIFNYIELRNELISKGHIFKTKSDTETVVHSWEEWGVNCFNKFNGQWALAIWDKKNKKTILSRDRHGIRPLYYTKTNSMILFASEIKAIFTETSIGRYFSREGLSEIFTLWSPVAPNTAFEGIYELEPGHFAVIENDQIVSKAYWTIEFPAGHSQKPIFKDCVQELKELLISATKLRFERSDVPVGAYLSGGIDSSVTASIVSRYTDVDLKTFSLSFEESEFDEGAYQIEISRRLGTDHTSISVSNKEIAEVFPEVVKFTERPILRTAPAPLFLLSKLVRESNYKVVVTGEGADEVLAGYDIFREAKVRRIIAENPESPLNDDYIGRLYPWMKRTPGRTPAFAKTFFSRDLDLNDPALSHRPRWNTSAAIKRILTADLSGFMNFNNPTAGIVSALPAIHHGWEDLSRAQWFEYKTLLSGYILSAQGDRMLMGNSVEGRFPFLDCRLVDFANSLPADYKLSNLTEKFILKEAFSDLIPKSILNRPKQPYRSPDALSFFGGPEPEWIDEVTERTLLEDACVFNPLAVEQLLTKCRKKEGREMSNSDNMMTTAVLSTMLAYKSIILESQRETEPPKPMDVFGERRP